MKIYCFQGDPITALLNQISGGSDSQQPVTFSLLFIGGEGGLLSTTDSIVNHPTRVDHPGYLQAIDEKLGVAADAVVVDAADSSSEGNNG